MAAILAIGRAPYILVKVLCSLDCINYCSNCQDFDSLPFLSIIIPGFSLFLFFLKFAMFGFN